MDYQGRYRTFDVSRIRTHPVAGRANRTRYEHLCFPDAALAPAGQAAPAIVRIADAVVAARRAERAVICFTGAHLIKNGLGPLLADLVRRGAISLVAGTGATAIHDFELALLGETSEDVPRALPDGRFGMAWEFALFNAAMRLGHARGLGLGEALGRFLCEEAFRREALAALEPPPGARIVPAHPEASVLSAAYAAGVPMTLHVGIGTDVTDQHPHFDPAAKGGTSGRDFLIFADEVARLAGGVFLNIGSAVTGPEVLLKAVSMAANVGAPPRGLLTADFDLRPHRPEDLADESRPGYYFRDQKSVVARVPAAFGGNGLYIQGDLCRTFPHLYRAVRERL